MATAQERTDTAEKQDLAYYLEERHAAHRLLSQWRDGTVPLELIRPAEPDPED